MCLQVLRNKHTIVIIFTVEENLDLDIRSTFVGADSNTVIRVCHTLADSLIEITSAHQNIDDQLKDILR